MINDLIDLARGEEQREDSEELRLDLLVEEVVERARRHSPTSPLAAVARADHRRPPCLRAWSARSAT